MKSIVLIVLLCVLSFSCKKASPENSGSGSTLSSQTIHITVNAAAVNNNISAQYRGINITENWENQSYWNYPITPATTINTLKANIIRFGSDDYFWADSPFTAPSPKLIDYGPNEYLSQQTDIIESDGIHFKSRILNVDDFIALCRATGSEPEIIIPYNRIYYTPLAGDNTTTKEDFLKNAESLVRYCNITKGYNVKFWEIGNETWGSAGNNRGITSAEYAADIPNFSKRMKAVDPTIKIMVNGNSTAWFQNILLADSPYVDYVNISYYPDYGIFSNYDDYRTYNKDFGADQNILNAVNAINSSGNAGKIKLIITEYNAVSFGGVWKDTNDLGHALVSFQMGADLMNNPNVYFASFWNLRWYYGDQAAGIPWQPIDTSPKTAFNAADSKGNLNCNGQAIALLYNNVFGVMVSAVSDNQLVRSFACNDKVSGKMNIFLVNKDRSAQTVNINLKNISKTTGSITVFAGTNDTDSQPTFGESGDLAISNGSATLSLKPLSITLIKL